MRLTHLELDHFRSYESLSLDLSSVSCAALIGRNGAGKSTIPIAVEWCFFGGTGADDLLRWGAPRGGVTLTFSHDEDVWRLSRGRERGRKSWLVVERLVGKEWDALDLHTVQETQRFVETVLGFDQDAYRATIYSPQGQVGALAAMSPGDRKGLLANLLGLGSYEEWRSEAAGEAREVRGGLTATAGLLLGYQERHAALTATLVDADALKRDGDAWADQLDVLEGDADTLRAAAARREAQAGKVRLRAQLNAQMKQLKARADEIRATVKRAEELRALIDGGAGARERLAVAREGYERHRDARHRAMTELTAAQADARSYEAEGQALYRDLHAVSDRETAARGVLTATARELGALDAPAAVCSECGQTVDAEHREQARARATARGKEADALLEKATEDRRRIEAARAVAREKHEAAKAREAAIPAPAPFDTTEMDACDRDVTALNRAEAAYDALPVVDVGEVDRLREQHTTLKTERDTLPTEVEPEGSRTVAQVLAQITDARQQLAAVERRLEAHERALEEIAVLEAQVRTVEAKVLVDTDRAEALEVCAAAFSRDGIPSMILDNAVGGIEAATNENLERLGTDMRVRLLTQVGKRSGKGTKETLEIMVDDGAFERPLGTFSGGEGYRVHIALRMGLASVLASSSGSAADFLLIDEPTDLDPEGVAALAELLPRTGRQVLLVTHEEELVDSLPQRLNVNRERSSSAASTVEVS